MRNCLSGLGGRIGAIFLMVMLGLAAARMSSAAPSEEDIPESSSPKTAPSHSGSVNPHKSAQRAEDNAASEGSDQESTGDEAAQAPSSFSSAAPLSAPRAVFPYIVRSGDTPAGIAALFGVSVADLMRVNHLRQDTDLMIGDTLRVPNPSLAREREFSSEIDRLTLEKQAAEQRAEKIQQSISGLRGQVQDLQTSNAQYGHDLHALPWWRATAVLAAGASALMLVIMLVALILWIVARSRFRAVAEMNESLRRLDYKYKAALAKAELRFQELYGRRRRGIQEGQERSKTPEEIEIEQLNRQLKEVLEHHLQRLESSGPSAGRARWRERLAGIGAPLEARSIRR